MTRQRAKDENDLSVNVKKLNASIMKDRKKNFALDICTKEKACPFDIPEKTKKRNDVRSIRSMSP